MVQIIIKIISISLLHFQTYNFNSMNLLKKTCKNCGHVSSCRKDKCGDCLITRYCNRKCQKDDWIQHKSECLEICKSQCRRETMFKLFKIGIILSDNIGEGVKLCIGNFLENGQIRNDGTMHTELCNHFQNSRHLMYVLKNIDVFITKSKKDIRTETNETTYELHNEISESLKNILDDYVHLSSIFAETYKYEALSFQCGNYLFEIDIKKAENIMFNFNKNITLGAGPNKVLLTIRTFKPPSGSKRQNESINEVVDSLKKNICKIFVCDD